MVSSRYSCLSASYFINLAFHHKTNFHKIFLTLFMIHSDMEENFLTQMLNCVKICAFNHSKDKQAEAL